MDSITFATRQQAEFANNLHRAASNLDRALASVAAAANRDRQTLSEGYRPMGIGHQVLSEVVAYQAQFETLSSMALSQGLTLEQVNLLVTSKDIWATTED